MWVWCSSFTFSFFLFICAPVRGAPRVFRCWVLVVLSECVQTANISFCVLCNMDPFYIPWYFLWKKTFFSVFLLVVVYCLACPLNEQRYNVNHTPSHTQSKSIALSFVLLALCHFITTITRVARSTLCAPSHTQIHSHFLYEFFAFTFFFVRCESIREKKIKYDLPFHCFSFLVLYFSFSILRHAAASFYSSKIVCSSRKWFSVVRMKISSANDWMWFFFLSLSSSLHSICVDFVFCFCDSQHS